MSQKYGKAAVRAVEIFKQGNYEITQSWDQAMLEQFPDKQASRKKVCPKTAFLGFCEEGLVIGVPKGSYTKGVLNKAYAIRAVNIVRHSAQDYSVAELWSLVMQGEDKVHNSQMDVVLGLKSAGMLWK